EDLEVASGPLADVSPPVQVTPGRVDERAGTGAHLTVVAAEEVLALDHVEGFVLVRVHVRGRSEVWRGAIFGDRVGAVGLVAIDDDLEDGAHHPERTAIARGDLGEGLGARSHAPPLVN